MSSALLFQATYVSDNSCSSTTFIQSNLKTYTHGCLLMYKILTFRRFRNNFCEVKIGKCEVIVLLYKKYLSN